MSRPYREKFENRYIPEPMSGCWLWVGHINWTGYGSLHNKGKTRSAHRVSWELAFGDIPDGLLVCHKCDVRCCVNPHHLFLGTAKDNSQDRDNKGRNGRFQKRKTHCKRGHERTGYNLMNNGGCRTCLTNQRNNKLISVHDS